MNITADFKAAFRQHALVYQKSLVFFFYWHVYFAVFQIDTTCVLFFAKNIVIFFNTNLYQTVGVTSGGQQNTAPRGLSMELRARSPE